MFELDKHQLHTGVGYIFACYSYLCYIFYGIADDDFIGCKLE